MLHEQISLTPNEPRFHLALAEALLEDQVLDEAETCIHRAIELQPALAAAQHLLSRLHQQRGRLPEAIAAARLAVEHRPQAVETILHLATLRSRSAGRGRGAVSAGVGIAAGVG